jgi:hypothetical protein
MAIPEHDHSHEGEAGHTHDHGHEHGWGPWRYAVLLLPVMLYFLGLPDNKGYGELRADTVDPSTIQLEEVAPNEDGEVREVSFQELTGLAYSPDKRKGYSGKMFRLKGQFVPSPYGDRVFSLVRMRMSCCAADAVPVEADILVDPQSKDVPNGAALHMRWVEVKGQLRFVSRQVGNREEWRTVLLVRPSEKEPLLGENGLIKEIEEQPAFISY